jgi:hypothetical protein
MMPWNANGGTYLRNPVPGLLSNGGIFRGANSSRIPSQTLRISVFIHCASSLD